MDTIQNTAPALEVAAAEIMIPIEAIEVGKSRLRKAHNVGKIKEIAESIAARGLTQSITVARHPKKEGEFILGAGAYRLAAHKWLAGRGEGFKFATGTVVAEPSAFLDPGSHHRAFRR